MKRDKWTQQLHDKLAEHEVAAPEGLWADIEAALNQQQAVPAQQRPTRSRFVTLRRWAVAASVAALLLGGGYLWWSTQSVPAPVGEELLAQSVPAPQGEGLGVGSVASSDRAPEIQSGEILQTPPLTPPLGGRGVAALETPPLEGRGMAAQEEPQPQMAENPQRQITEEPQMAEEPHRQITEQPRHHTTERPVTKQHHQVTLGLYAMNGLDNQNSNNGVQMADALAKQYMETYANSYSASARSSEPIWLTGYEERQHHHRPITYGLSLSYPLSGRISLTTGVVYTKLQSDFTQVMRSQQIQQEQTLHYVGIPLNLSYRLWAYNHFKTYLSAGVKADWNVATHVETEGVSQHLSKDRLQWSLNGSLGLQYDIVPQLGFYVEPSLNWYPDNGSNIQNYFKDKPLNLGIQLGLRLNLE